MEGFSIRAMKRMIRSQGEKRVSKPAAESLDQVLVDWGVNIAEEALEVAQANDRETVRPEDVRATLDGSEY